MHGLKHDDVVFLHVMSSFLHNRINFKDEIFIEPRTLYSLNCLFCITINNIVLLDMPKLIALCTYNNINIKLMSKPVYSGKRYYSY